MAAPALVLKAAASILANEKSRKAVGWVLIAVLSPIILLLAFFCTSFSGGAEHNRTVVDLCFHGGAVPEGTPEEYQAYIQEMRDSFVLLDAAMQTVEGQMEDGDGLDDVRVKAVFFALYFGADDPAAHAGQTFVDCFVTYEERTRTVTTVDEDGNEIGPDEDFLQKMDDLMKEKEKYKKIFVEPPSITLSEYCNVLPGRGSNDDDAICSIYDLHSAQEVEEVYQKVDEKRNPDFEKVGYWAMSYKLSMNHLFGID